MDCNNNIRTNLQRLRKERNITQDVLAEVLDISVQAISKWETGVSLPDIMQLPKIAQYYGISIDYLFYSNETRENREYLNIPDDDILRIIQFKGNKILGEDMWEQDKVITLKFPDEISENKRVHEVNIVAWGNIEVNGNVGGYVESRSYINCGNVGGYVESKGNVSCGNVHGYVECEEYIMCGNISGYLDADGNVTCGDVMNYVECSGNIRCKSISGYVECEGDIIYEK